MSVIGGSQPIITSGLVYGLDFGNTRTYTAGSTTARSLAYDTAPPSVISGSYGASYTADNKSLILLSTTSNYIQRTGSISAFDPQGNFTVCLFLNIATSGPFFVQNQTSVNFAIQSNTSSFDIGFYNPTTGNYYTRRYPTLLNTGSVYLACRYASGSMDLFVNGLPVTSSQADITIPAIVTGSYSTSILYKDIAGSTYIGATPRYISSFSGSLSQMLVYNRALSSTEIYSNYVPHITSQYQLAAPPITKPYTLDENTLMYVSASGVTSSAYITAIDNFVTGLKSAGIWNKLGAVYPVVGSTTSSQALNLKEPGVNRLVYSGSWTATTSGSYPSSSTSLLQLPGFNYPTIATSSAHITYLSYDLPQVTASLVGVDKPLRALGGEIYYSGSRIYHAFKITGTSSFQVLDSGLTAVDVLAIAGGGSGGSRDAGAGGAGGLIYSSSFAVTTGAYNVVVGSGGREVGYTGNPERGNSGENSTFSTITSFGGGSGGAYGSIAGNGGSGGGAGGVGSPGTGSAGQGNNGGTTAFAFTGGGGGGAGSAGQNAPSNEIGGAGGSGSFFAQYAGLPLGSPAGWFAGGGGGGGGNGGGAGGIGGGGAQNPGSSGQASSGVVNTGGGGGTARIGGVLSGTGGSGIVIISYNSSQAAFTSSFGLSLTNTDIVGNLHSTTTSGITGGGNVGLITVSRTGSSTLSIHKNTTSSIFTAPVTASILGSVYGNASNYAGVPSNFGTTTLSYLSYGAGLSPSEVTTYHTLVQQLQNTLRAGNLLLDQYPSASAAYSLRKVYNPYFGPAIKVRRDSDNTLRDIGFTPDGQLDTVGLLDFVGSGSGYVTTWYDQSTRGNNASNNTNATQPLIISSGSISTEGNKPAVFGYNGTALAATNVLGPYETWFSVYKQQGPGVGVFSTYFDGGTYNHILGYGNTGGANSYFRPGTGGATQYGGFGAIDASTDRILRTIIYNNNFQYTDYFNSSSIYYNNTFSSPIATNNNIFVLGGYTTAFGVQNTKWQEVVYYDSSKESYKTNVESNINNYYKIYGSVTASFDSDYSAFISASGITATTQSNALQVLVSDLKQYGLWDKMRAIYPMVADKLNTIPNSKTFSNFSGVATSSQADPFGGTDAVLVDSYTSQQFYYNRAFGIPGTTGSQSVYIRASGSGYQKIQFGAYVYYPGGSTWVTNPLFEFNNRLITASAGGYAEALTNGWYRIWINPVLTGSYTSHEFNLNTVYMGGGVADNKFYFYGPQYETNSTGRPSQYNATTSSISVEFVTSSMLNQMKYNLKNPADTDAAYRLSFSGSWVVSYEGATGNGIDAVAYPKLTPRTAGFTTASGHISYYQGNAKQLTSGSLFSSRQTAGADNYFAIKTDAGLETSFGTAEGWGAGRSFNSYTFTAPIGFVMANAFETSTLLYQRNQLIQQTSQATLNNIDSDITINATSINGTPSGYSSAECNFVTIGDGLTAYQAKALYWIIQKYQITLGRQVY